MGSGKKGDRRYLHCTTHHFSKDYCEGAFISVDRLERMVIAEINRLSEEYLDKDELERSIEFGTHLKEQKERLIVDNSIYRKKIEEYSKGIRELYMDKVKGLISDGDYTEMSKDFIGERDRMERQICENEKKIGELDSQLELGDNRRELIERYTNLEHLNRETVDTLIDYINIGRRIPGTRNVPIEIHWNF